jgi:hypothetical protein
MLKNTAGGLAMKKLVMTVSIAALFSFVSLFSNVVQPAQAQVQQAIGILQLLSNFLPSSKNPKTEAIKQLTIEEYLRQNADQDIVPSSFKQAQITKWATRGKLVDLNGTNIENSFIENCIVSWYSNARINNSDAVIIFVLALSVDNKKVYHIGTISFNRSDSNEESELQALLQNQEEKNAFLKKYTHIFLRAFRERQKS